MFVVWQVSAAIQERAKRIYDKYGNVMLDVKGMTKAGVERKATCQALFSKLLYLAGDVTHWPLAIRPCQKVVRIDSAILSAVTRLLTLTLEPVCVTECDSLLPHVAELANKTNVPDVFGATQEDTERLRIVNLEEVIPAMPFMPQICMCHSTQMLS